MYDLLRRVKTEKIGRKSLTQCKLKKKLTLELASISAIRFEANLSKKKRKISIIHYFQRKLFNTFQNKKQFHKIRYEPSHQ